MPMSNYSHNVADEYLYDGFVDVVITFPCTIRLAGIELLNPWNNKLSNDKEFNYWKYLPKVFSIFKVNDKKINDFGKTLTYENDIAKITDENGNTTFHPINCDYTETSEDLIFLGRYSVNWENISSQKCFFKFNEDDRYSKASKKSELKVGTATWECKQIVIRIFKAYNNKSDSSYIMKHSDLNDMEENPLFDNICNYILDKEISYGTTKFDKPIEFDDIKRFYMTYLGVTDEEYKKISNALNKNDSSPYKSLNVKFGGSVVRRYDRVCDVCFTAGLEYKLGGIQLLLSPDIFSVSEMKMHNYANTTNNKVFIGEWNKDRQNLEYYGAGIIKTSQLIDVSYKNMPAIIWKHNFNIPPKYLDVQVFAQFTVDYDTFYAGDVISNLVNVNKEPLTLRLTGTDVTLNVSNGICFTNPETGEFMVFKNGKGIQMDRPGHYDALAVAEKMGANVVATQSIVSTKIEADDATKGDAYPFKIYFIVKRLF